MYPVSVLMSVYNGESYLSEAIDSILSQSFKDFEFIIVDDGSTDRTKEILDSYNDPRIVRLVHEKNKGLIPALNYGLSQTRGRLIARQDADDIALANRLEKQVCLFNAHPSLVLLGSAYYEIDEQGRTVQFHKHPESDTAIRWHMMFNNGFAHTSVIFRAEVVKTNRLYYSAQAMHAEDFELWLRLLAFGQGMNTSEPLVKHRCHRKQVSNQQSAWQRRTANEIVKARLESLAGFSPAEKDIEALRNWLMRMPLQLDKNDLRRCMLLIRIFKAFCQSSKTLNSAEISRIRLRLFHRILKAFSFRQTAMLWHSGLLPSMIRQDALAVLAHLTARGISLIKSHL